MSYELNFCTECRLISFLLGSRYLEIQGVGLYISVKLFKGRYVTYGPGSSVGIATDYGMDGPGSNPGGDEIFLPSRPVLRPTQAPVKWVPGLSRG